MYNVYYRDINGMEFYIGTYDYYAAKDEVDALRSYDYVQRAWMTKA